SRRSISSAALSRWPSSLASDAMPSATGTPGVYLPRPITRSDRCCAGAATNSLPNCSSNIRPGKTEAARNDPVRGGASLGTPCGGEPHESRDGQGRILSAQPAVCGRGLRPLVGAGDDACHCVRCCTPTVSGERQGTRNAVVQVWTASLRRHAHFLLARI